MQRIKSYPHSEYIELHGKTLHIDQIISLVKPLLTEDRIETIARVIPQRTRNVSVLLENTLDQGNVSAVMRSMEAMGFHQLHNIENEQLLKSNRVTRGADKWLDIRRWKNTESCLEELKKEDCQIVVTHLSEDSIPIEEVDFSKKSIICFGHEKNGISKLLEENSDVRCKIPMYGFSQSYNISVAAALSLHIIKEQRLSKLGYHGDLNELDQKILTAIYYLKSAPEPQNRLFENLLKRPELF